MVKKKSITRLESLHSKMIEKGITAKEANDFDIKTWNKNFQVGKRKITNNKSLKGAKRLLRQIDDRQNQVVDYYIKKREITNEKFIKFIKKETQELFLLEEKKGVYKTTKIKGKFFKIVVKADKSKEKTDIFYIKSTDSASYKRQLDIIRKRYGVVKIYKARRVKYKEFVNKEKFLEFAGF